VILEKLTATQFSLIFDRKRGRYTLYCNDQKLEQNVCEFLLTISYLAGKNIEEHLLNTDNHYDTVRIPMTSSGKTLTLNLADYLALRNVYSQEMFLLRLDDILTTNSIGTPGLR
jgi:hypothetical protein